MAKKKSAKRASNKPASTTSPKKKAERKRVSAEDMSAQQRSISISEFFTKNRHLLGFDNASRALMTSVKEAIDNSLDACEEAGILPDITVRLEQLTEKRYRMTVEDNGPGIVKAQVPKVFGQLLYGSKFHRRRQSRGQQGIGISAAGMYGQLTTGKPVHVTSKTAKGRKAHSYELMIDTSANKPKIMSDDTHDWADKDHGTRISIEMEASYKGGKRGVDEFVQSVALANPHLRLEYWRPNRPPVVYPRVTDMLPPEAQEIKPHPYGVELGELLRMAHASPAKSMVSFMQSDFSRISVAVAKEILAKTKVGTDDAPPALDRLGAEAIHEAIANTKIMSPPTNCLAPIGELAMLEGMKAVMVQQHMSVEEAKERRKQSDKPQGKLSEARAVSEAEQKVQQALQEASIMVAESDDDDDDELDEASAAQAAQKAQKKAAADKEAVQAAKDAAPLQTGVIQLFGRDTFMTAVTRAPKVYRGNPFQVEAALAWGGEMEGDGLAQVYRFANRVPLLYQQGACAMTQSVVRTNWKGYHVQQSRGALPTGPLLLMVHIASVWVPFTSEAKEAVAHYDEIITELKYAVQECGRRLSRHISRRRKVADAEKKRRYIEQYIPHIGEALQEILQFDDHMRNTTVEHLTGILENQRKV